MVYYNNFEKYLAQIYPTEQEIKVRAERNTSASYLDLLLSIGRDGQLRTPFTTKGTIFLSCIIKSMPASMIRQGFFFSY